MLHGLKYVSESANSGYGRAGRGYLRALARTGIELTWTPMVPGDRWNMYLEPVDHRSFDDEFSEFCNRPSEYDAVMVHLIGPYFRRWREREPKKPLIGITVWETDRLLDGGLDDLRYLDGLIVPCRWNAEVFREAGIGCPIHVAPHIVDASHLVPGELHLPGVAEGDFVFYSIGEWKDRKGMDLTVAAFCRAFTRRDPVVLVVKTGSTNERRRRRGWWWHHVGRWIETPAWEVDRIRRRHPEAPRVVLLTRDLSETEMGALHSRAECYVSLTRAEGWGLGAYEAAFAGRPVIMTGHGGQLDFLPAHLASLVEFRLVPAAPTGELDQGYRGHLWAEPDLEHAVQLMRDAFERREDARERGRMLQAFVRANFEPDRIARGMIDFAAGLV